MPELMLGLVVLCGVASLANTQETSGRSREAMKLGAHYVFGSKGGEPKTSRSMAPRP